MKQLNKRKQNLSSAGEVINSCACRTHACSCSVVNFDAKIDNSENLYYYSLKGSVGGVEVTSINII